MAKFYTGFGDRGKTAIGSKIVDKTDVLVNAMGEIDELNAELGVALENLHDKSLRANLLKIQEKLFVAGAQIASLMDKWFTPKSIITSADVNEIEHYTDILGKTVGNLNTFVLPGGSNGSAYLDRARTVARRAERAIVALSKSYKVDKNVLAYINRLSSFLFVAARYINKINDVKERHPKY